MERPISVFCAGSLRIALLEALGDRAELRPGPSGVLRREIELGARPDIFISADLAHARVLEAAGLYGPLRVMAANGLSLILRPGLSSMGREALDLMLDPGIALGTSTPVADPGGDYAWRVFARADSQRPGTGARLEAKAQCLVGGPGQRFDEGGGHPVVRLFRERLVDVFLGYRTTALVVLKQVPGTTMLQLPPELSVRAEYGLTILRHGADPRAIKAASHLLSPDGRAVFARYGFLPGDLV